MDDLVAATRLDRTSWADVEAAAGRLAATTPADVPPDLRTWSRSLVTDGGPARLLGLRVPVAVPAALLWNGALLQRTGRGELERLVLAVLTASPGTAAGADLLRGVRAGLAVGRALAAAPGPSPVARASTGAVATAVCLATVEGAADEQLPALLELAGLLMVVGPVGADGVAERSLRAGHELVAGWLAWSVRATGTTAVRGGLAHTLETVCGTDLRLPPTPVAIDDDDARAPSHLRVAALAGALA